jgi:hypothetical protein
VLRRILYLPSKEDGNVRLHRRQLPSAG